MLIGVPKEIKNHEYRVGLTPASARELVAHGHDVLGGKRGGYRGSTCQRRRLRAPPEPR
jgi:alanine dehydrogenase